MNEDKNLNELFKRLEGQWDNHEPVLGHQQRFLDRLDGKKKKHSPILILLPIAAAVLILFGIFNVYNEDTNGNNNQQVAKVSPKVQETQTYFAAIIEKELAKVEKEKSPETQMIVQDALVQMKKLEQDYDKLTQELIEKGESKQLIHAMITNLQTRISFLEDVLTRIENIKKIKEDYHENATT
ncbi:hypothetical protein [Flavobacterium beibuense]|uniref:Anti-sigma factor n=1 Tax=Flavobacterium beibuense TaxID=657326 RepID=A0A444W949_9FLAO|nr:hypothetical protein [Flavobacterium beibuense]RYJ42435.1 hypothetical protein NU09_2221 [Flavobacterium beibuense]